MLNAQYGMAQAWNVQVLGLYISTRLASILQSGQFRHSFPIRATMLLSYNNTLYVSLAEAILGVVNVRTAR